MKSRIFMSMLVIALAAALVGGATMSLFTDVKETEDFQYTAGTVIITPSELTHVIDFGSIENMAPGDKVYGSFTVKNEGSLDIWFTVEAITGGDLFDEDGSSAAQVNIDSPQVILGQGEEATVFFDVYLPREAGNDYQGKWGTLKFKINAEQAAHNLPKWARPMGAEKYVSNIGGRRADVNDYSSFYVEFTLHEIEGLEEVAVQVSKNGEVVQTNISSPKLFATERDYPAQIGTTFANRNYEEDGYWYVNRIGNWDTDYDWNSNEGDLDQEVKVSVKTKWGTSYTMTENVNWYPIK